MLSFYNHAYGVIRSILGDGVSVYIGDMFNPQSFNWYWHAGNPIEATNVFLDSHIYACFVDDLKAMTPRQHITQVCRYERAHINQCCWDGWPPEPTELGRFVGEWTGAFDRTPSPELERAYANTLQYQALSDDDKKKNKEEVLKYVSPTLTPERQEFLKQYVLAQMMTYEATPEDSKPWIPTGGALDFHGWFFWNFKMEADVYQEWDYLRGVAEGWIPKLQRGLSIEDQFGITCEDLEEDASDCTDGVVDPYPPIKGWKGVACKPTTVFGRANDIAVGLLFIFSLLTLAAATVLFCAKERLPRSHRFLSERCPCCARPLSWSFRSRSGDYQRIKTETQDLKYSTSSNSTSSEQPAVAIA